MKYQRVLAAALAIGMALALTACGGKEPVEETGPVAPAASFVDAHFVGDEVAEIGADLLEFAFFGGEGSVHGGGVVHSCWPFVTFVVDVGVVVTGHKCQGGEWKNVFVDYEGRTGLDNDSLRWNYTATTRAQKTLYVINLPHITPFDKFRIDNISTVKKIKPEFRIYGEINKDPFHPDSAAVYLRAKTQCILYNMEFTPYKIKSIEREAMFTKFIFE